MTQFGSYTGKNFLELKLKPREWLVENLIKAEDTVILVGNEKSGKSLFIFQLICSLTSCHPFLDHFNIPRAIHITYIQLEGELADSQDRFKRMIKTLDFNPDLFHLMFLPPLELQERGAIQGLRDEIKKFHTPDIIIIDPIYFAFTGKLGDDEVVRKFIGNMRILKDFFHCAIILVHHTHKEKWDYAGGKIEEGDEAMFGSKFLKAWADHTLLFMYDKAKNIRTLSCNTQRSGDIVQQCNLRLIEPVPLYFEEMEKDPSKEAMILALLSQAELVDGLPPDEIMERLKIGRTVFYNSIKNPLAKETIIKSEGTRPIRYVYNRKQR